jgi:hypothetical protein
MEKEEKIMAEKIEKVEKKPEVPAFKPAKRNRGKPSVWIKNLGGRVVLVEEKLAAVLIAENKAVAVDAPK